MLKEAFYYTRMAWFYGAYVLKPPHPDPYRVLQDTAARRDENFLELVRTGIFENPRTPYHQLMRRAGCTFEDLSKSIRRDGLETTLERLRRDGVYLTNDEVKGKPVRRGGVEIPNDPAATGHPNSPGGIESRSSGSRSRGTATPASNAYRRHRECYEILAREEFGVRGRVTALVRNVLPSPAGLIAASGLSHWGHPVERWYAVGKSFRTEFHYRLVTAFMVAEARLLGRRIPFPAYLEKDSFTPVARWISDTKKNGRSVFVRSNVSSCTRVCAAALDAGLDIAGTIFQTSGEGLTPARRSLLDSAGVRAFPRYVISEIGTVGIGCAHLTGNSVHLFHDSVGAIVHRRPAPYVGSEVNSLLLTSTHPLASRVLINAEMEDAAILGTANCDCVFARTGYRTVLQDVYSFGKLSAHGLTLGGDPLLKILEERLPGRFGGVPGDYQLVEQEARTQMELRLRVSPRLGTVDPAVVQGFFLDEIRGVHGGSLSRRVWESTGSFQVEIEEPYRTSTGKVLPLHLTAFGGQRGPH